MKIQKSSVSPAVMSEPKKAHGIRKDVSPSVMSPKERLKECQKIRIGCNPMDIWCVAAKNQEAAIKEDLSWFRWMLEKLEKSIEQRIKADEITTGLTLSEKNFINGTLHGYNMVLKSIDELLRECDIN